MRLKSTHLALLIALLFFTAAVWANNMELGYDESRHAMQSSFFMQYFKTLLSGKFMSISDYLSSYAQRNPAIGWYALYDPPFHAMVQGLLMLVFGPSQFVVNASNAFLASVLSLIFFMFSKWFFKDDTKALLCYALFLFNPFIFQYARTNFLTLTVGFTFLAWYYLTFIAKGMHISVRVTSRLKFRVNLTAGLGGLFLAVSALTKYPSVIFAAAVMLVHTLYPLYTQRRLLSQKGLKGYIEETGTMTRVLTFFSQATIVFVLAYPWISFSLLDRGMLSKVLWAGSLVGREGAGLSYYLYYLIASIKDLKYVTLLSLIPMAALFLDSRSDRQKRLMVFSILAMMVTATFVISNRQLRYAIQFVPLLYVFSFAGLVIVTAWIARRWATNKAYIYASILLLVFFLVQDYSFNTRQLSAVGPIDYELEDFLRDAKDPAYFMNIKGHGDHGASSVVNGYQHKYTPDLFNFKVIKSSPNYYDPSQMSRLVDIVYWHGTGISQKPEVIVDRLVQMSKQVNTYLVLFKFEREDDLIISSLQGPLQENGFQVAVLDYYVVIFKEI